LFVYLSVCFWAAPQQGGGLFFGVRSEAVNNSHIGGVFLSVRSENPLPREHLSLNNNKIIKYKITGALSPGVKRSERGAEIQPNRKIGEVVKSRHA
jgi:hypothetical protein